MILVFNYGDITCYQKGYKSQTTISLTGDNNGCELNQLHLTGTDSDWNCTDYDFIIELVSFDEATGALVVSVVSDNSKSNW